ncbi:MAG: OmpL47-type beta-barrel domain-containing protein, partial [Promethearchaeota archaeon]
EKGIDKNNITAELCGYEIAALTDSLVAPTSFGFAKGDWVDYFIPENYRYEEDETNPKSSGDANFDDWLERGNDNWNTAFYLNSEFEVPGHWYDLSLHNNFDYYSFHAESGDSIEVQAWCEPGADITLETRDTGDGSVIDSDHENGDTDGWIHLSWTAAYSGDYIIGFTSDDYEGPFNDAYDFQISINGVYGPDYYSDYENKGPDSMFVHQVVEFLYTNPFGDDVLVMRIEGHKFADMSDDPIFVDYKEQGRIHQADINRIEGPYFSKDLDMGSISFKTSMESMFYENEGVVSPTFNNGTNWVEFIGQTGEGEDFYFFAERFPNHNYGAVQYYEQSVYNNTINNFIKKEKNIVIKSSISGLINDTVGSELGVSVGDTWTYVAMEDNEEHQWGGTENHDWNGANVHNVTVTVTHILHVNRTVVAVIGSLEHWSNDDPEFPEHIEFFPLLVWNTEDPLSFLNYGGHGKMDNGPPFLLPVVSDWTVYESSFIPWLESTVMNSGDVAQLNIQPKSIRIKWHSEYSETDYNSEKRGLVILDVNDDGIVTHLKQEEERRESYWMGDHEEGYERRGRLDVFLVESSLGCITSDASLVTDLLPGDQFVWDHNRYHPAGMWGPDDPGDDPNHIFQDRVTFLTTYEACDNFIVFLGSMEWKNWDDSSFHPRTWNYYDDNLGWVSTDINIWLLGSIRDNDIWSWFGTQFFDIGIQDFALYESDIIDLMNFALELPDGISLTSSDITISGLTFEISLVFEENAGEGDINHIMKFAANDKGVMQEMFMGSKYANDTWRDWEHNVLTQAPSGYAVGPILSGLPDFTAPVVSITAPNTTDIEPGATIEFDVTDESGVASVEYKWDSDPYTTITAPYSVSAPTDPGSHTLYIRTIDTVGNERVAEFNFKVLGEGTGTDTSPFDIPAYPVESVVFFSIFSVIGLMALVMHKKRV